MTLLELTLETAIKEAGEFEDVRLLKKDAECMLELLKEQEPVHIQKRELAHMWFWCCGSCGVAITEGDKFCRMCGKEVKWDG